MSKKGDDRITPLIKTMLALMVATVAGRSGKQNIGVEAGLTRNLRCRVKRMDCH